MLQRGSRAALPAALSLALICTGRASAAPTVYAGLQGMILTGTHTDIAGSQHGAAVGAILQLGAREKRLSLRLEGIPPVSLPQKPSAYYGAATPQLSLLNGALRYAVDRDETLSLGAGETIVNQRTALPNLSQVVTSRLAGLRIEAAYRHAYSPLHFWEAVIGAAPHLYGSDHYTYSISHPDVDKSEIAAEEDFAVSWGIERRNAELLFGLRSIDFSAKYVATGVAGDRNNGGGAIVEWRTFIDR